MIGRTRTRIALVILDLILPEVAGGEMCDSLKSMDPDVDMLLASGCSRNGKASESL